MSALTGFLKNSVLFAGLDTQVLDGIAGLMRNIRLTKDNVLFWQDDKPDGCFVLCEGSMKVSVLSEQGDEILLCVLGPGDVIGEMGLVDGAPRSATVTALASVELAHLPTCEFDRFAADHPSVYRHLLHIMSTRLRITNDAFAVHQTLPLDGRLAHVLLRLAEGFGNPLEGDRLMIFHRFTQNDLGMMAGARRENVSRQLKKWIDQGFLSKISQYYCIEDIEALRLLSRH